MVEKVISQFLEKITCELCEGHTVNLGDDFGIFSVKLRTANIVDNSPRTPKNGRLKVVFRENKGLKQRLKLYAGVFEKREITGLP